ncbi:MAG TPA: adenosine kinase [Allosphingosinicella sp.]
MAAPRLDVLAIGNAIVDVIAPADEALVEGAGLVKGSMRLLCEAEALDLHARMTGAREISGGSAANTAVGLAALGGKVGFVGQVGDDRLGALFTRELHDAGIEYATPPDPDGVATARCLILVTDDAQRSMCTFGGAAHLLSPEMIDEQQVRDSAILYLEGYLWDSPIARAAMVHAIATAHEAGRKVALTPSDIACIRREHDRFVRLLADGKIDMLFLNEVELAALADADDVETAIAKLAGQVELLVVTHGAEGATAIHDGERVDAPAVPIDRVVDTTGAGDLFAAGFLYGHARGEPLAECLRLGAIAAAEVISHFGARPEADLKALIAR